MTLIKLTQKLILLLKQCFSEYQINCYSLVMNQSPLEKKDKYRAPFQHFKLYNVKNEKTQCNDRLKWLSYVQRFLSIFIPFIRDVFQKQPPEMFCKKGALKNFAKFTGKYLCQSLFFIKLQALRRLFQVFLDITKGSSLSVCIFNISQPERFPLFNAFQFTATNVRIDEKPVFCFLYYQHGCTETYLGPCQISIIDIGGALRDLKPFVQFKKVKNTPGGVLCIGHKMLLAVFQSKL